MNRSMENIFSNELLDDFDVNGFLSERFTEIKKEIHKFYPGYFDLAYKVHKLAYNILYKLDVKNQDGQAIVKAALFLHTLHNYAGVVISVEKGMTTQGKILLRSQSESSIKLKVLVNDDSYFEKFAKEDLFLQKSLGQSVLELHRIHETAFTEEEIEEVKLELKNKRNVKNPNIKLQELANIAGLDYLYLTVYQLSCLPVHASVRGLTDYIVLNEKGDIVEFNPLPNYSSLQKTIFSSIQLMLIAIECILEYLDVKYPKKEIEDIHEECGKELEILGQKMDESG